MHNGPLVGESPWLSDMDRSEKLIVFIYLTLELEFHFLSQWSVVLSRPVQVERLHPNFQRDVGHSHQNPSECPCPL